MLAPRAPPRLHRSADAAAHHHSASALIIGSCWGIFVFKEIRGKTPIRLFFVGAIITFVGMVMAAIGKSGA